MTSRIRLTFLAATAFLALASGATLAQSPPPAPPASTPPAAEAPKSPATDAAKAPATETPKASATDAAKAPTAKVAPKPEEKTSASLSDATLAVHKLSVEVGGIQKDLVEIRKHVEGLDKSLGNVDKTLTAAIGPEGLRIFVDRTSEVAYDRAKTLLALATGALALLIVLFLVLRRYIPARS